MRPENYLIILCGPTGIGKTGLAIQLAEYLPCEIISADSRQLFREMKIGTAVPRDDELKKIPHHFIHSHSVQEVYNASMYEQEVIAFLEKYFESHRIALLTGGSGMYIDAVCKGIDDLPAIRPGIRQKWLDIFNTKGIKTLQSRVESIDPAYYAKVDKQNPKRLLKAIEVFEQTGRTYSSFLTNQVKERPFKILKIGLNTDRDLLYNRINERVDKMIAAGLVEEARTLLPLRNKTPLKSVGYRELFAYFDGNLSLGEAIQKIKDHTRAYARRQITWFRRDPGIHWFDPGDIDAIKAWLAEKLASDPGNR